MENTLINFPSGLLKRGGSKEFGHGGGKRMNFQLLYDWAYTAKEAFRCFFGGPWYAPKPHQVTYLTKKLEIVNAKFHQNHKPILCQAR